MTRVKLFAAAATLVAVAIAPNLAEARHRPVFDRVDDRVPPLVALVGNDQERTAARHIAHHHVVPPSYPGDSGSLLRVLHEDEFHLQMASIR